MDLGRLEAPLGRAVLQQETEVKNVGQRERTACGEAGGRTSVCGPSLRSAANGPPDSWYNASVQADTNRAQL